MSGPGFTGLVYRDVHWMDAYVVALHTNPRCLVPPPPSVVWTVWALALTSLRRFSKRAVVGSSLIRLSSG
eukprot:15358138-Ditylum_brightwellii.AAC.3